MARPSAESLNRVTELVRKFAQMRGRTCLEVIRAVLATRTLARLGCDGGGDLTCEQCDAATSVLEGWIRKASDGVPNR